jgi:hypothetical protein
VGTNRYIPLSESPYTSKGKFRDPLKNIKEAGDIGCGAEVHQSRYVEISPLGRELVATVGCGPSFIAAIYGVILYGYVSVFTLDIEQELHCKYMQVDTNGIS